MPSPLPAAAHVNAEAVRARYREGVLTVTVPEAPPEPRQRLREWWRRPRAWLHEVGRRWRGLPKRVKVQ